MVRTITLELDELDYETIQTEIAMRQVGPRLINEDGRSEPCLPEGESNIAGAVFAEVIRDLNDYRDLYAREHPDPTESAS